MPHRPVPFLRQWDVIGNDVVLGVFTEARTRRWPTGSRPAPQLLGDAIVGRRVNVGAGSITANYDGEQVHQTTVGDDCHIGSGVVLIAPLVLEPGANVGAGTVVSQENVNRICAKRKST